MGRVKSLYANPFKQLKPHHLRFQLLIEQNVDGMVIIGSDRTIRFVNPAAETMFGKTWVELVGTEFHFPLLIGETSEITITTPNETTLQVEMRIVEIEWGEEKGYLASLRDITSRKREEAERKRNEMQMQKLESLGVLAGGIAHDFNNLLMTIVAHAGLAAKRMPLDSPERAHLLKIEQVALRGGELANQMLTYAGRGKPLIQPLHISQCIQEMRDLLSASISKGVALVYDLAFPLPLVKGDPAQLRQVVLNLIINASEAIGEKPGTITLRTGEMVVTKDYLKECHVPGELENHRCVYIEVIDTGEGIASEDLDKIFDPFFTTKFAGRGLGLAALLGIVRAHGGVIHVSSCPGYGTTVRVLLPEHPQEKVQPFQSSSSTQSPPQGKGTILVVDDEEDVRLAAQLILEDAGWNVLCAEDGKTGLELFRQQHQGICVILLDLSMPHMGGEELFKEIQQIRTDIPVVLSSGLSEEEAVKRFAGKPFFAFLQKPYQIKSLVEKINQASQALKDSSTP